MAGQSTGSGKRPWLAALLGTLVTGLGHLYLRRWKRGVGWFLAAIGVSAVFVPPEAARALLDGAGGDPETLAPLLVVAVASVADAYVLARLVRRETARQGGTMSSDAGLGPAGTVDDGVGAAESSATAEVGTECPECGKELDPDLGFCPWCTTRLSDDPAE